MKNWIKEYWIWCLAFMAFMLTWSAVVYKLNDWWILAGLIISNQLYRAHGENESDIRHRKNYRSIKKDIEEIKELIK